MKPGIYLGGTDVPTPGGSTPAPARDECLEALINPTGRGEAGSGRPCPRGRNGSGPTPRGDKRRGGLVTLGPDPGHVGDCGYPNL
uniref:DUF1263 domain-containing protein n=1 Tax=Oryza sativa subsp. japonica TaxID=39947 RepID=Q8S742_ORYSJ|nr:Unknown protein [Oryza sativa Japonica Group]